MLSIPYPLPKTSGIYRIDCIPNGKFYIGSAQNLFQRWVAHQSDLRKGKHHSRYLQRAWDKYGDDAFTFTVIELVLLPFLLEREQYWLDRTRAYDGRVGFNNSPTAGSSLGHKHSEESRRHMSESRKGRKMPPRSDEHRAKIAAAARKRMADPERRAAVSRVHKGKTISDEHKASAAAKIRGHKNSPETIAKVVAAHAMDFVVTDPDGNEYEVHNLAAFCREHDLPRRNLLSVAQGRTKQWEGWKCRYK